ncbi:hypothetical protein HID58_060849 [Brassica napus]|uniref:BnaCnng38270D protein n=4 Tax=Brassica TaxID=3705 RepID=A0A078JBA5_BRANA|nr:PREDICTED: uncharacterized protein LOC106342971 [Brassica oleracea var. oleracea]XP_013742202.1 uncharacterized protein BNACNNG38270D [Brassica napus]VDD09767.1 unnamed protein product [Brassica oleracea]KAH0884753.1 hypothetical protein HID58_060849 [Brassica napus]CAF1850376.1 unnamed protein product [Brassica napus]CDY61685.1 BnaCnng38270D [Brassica napus]
MDSSFTTPPPETAAVVMGENGFTVDPFLVEALQNPRHRLTILRMELDVQRFLQSQEQQQFEFQRFPTSYLRLAAHRVANHYGLATSVQDGGVDGNENIILVTKTSASKFPTVKLSDIPAAKQSQNGKFEHMKVSIKTRPSKGSGFEGGEVEKKRGPLRSVEERKEDYDRARARIFNGLTGFSGDESDTQVYERNPSLGKDDSPTPTKNLSLRETGPASRVAILRDSEKDRFDPDYDRNYKRYIRSLPVYQNFNVPPFNMMQQPYYQMGFTEYNHIPNASLNFGPPGNAIMSPYGTTVVHPGDAMYMQVPMMYAHSYEQLRNASLQAQFCQQPLSFEYMQNR